MNYQPYNQNLVNNPQQLGVSKPNDKKKTKLSTTKIIVGVVIGLQMLMIGLLAYGLYFPKNTLGDQIVNEVRKVAGVSESLVPLDIVQLDDNIISDLRNGNQIQEQVYKDVQSGDYVVIYEDRMIIYRRDGKEVIYNGKSPAQIAQDGQLDVLNKILARAKADGIIEEGNEEVPQASVVDDPQKLLAEDSDFYSRVQAGDLVVIFPEHQIILLYNPNNDSIYNSGKIGTVITEL
ncbi:hypothetical protein KC678_00490 [Candidatus Dojkabacteria bacterium]|uniref:Uncharacterized protein n=1 Tax=Candidatus Dojkabacteria bacterium TaxID=2099670 RepID=A0A955IAM3_9BACT|nr:hypothetical protein [Candidatus Dojkabacteria bacterium]